jgi:hypothetical protein
VLNDLCQWSTLQKGLIKYIKLNGIIPMKIQIEYAHLRVVVERKLVIAKKIVKVNHNQQSGEKHYGPIGCAIMIFLVP